MGTFFIGLLATIVGGFILHFIITKTNWNWVLRKLRLDWILKRPTVENEQEPQLIEAMIVDQSWPSIAKEKEKIPPYNYRWTNKDTEATVLLQGNLKTFYFEDKENHTRQKIITKDAVLMYKDVHTIELYMELLKFCKDNPNLTKTGAAVTAAEEFCHSSENSSNNTMDECVVAMKKLAAAGYIILPPHDGPMIYGHSGWYVSIEGDKQIEDYF
ncbi:hypothetical protein LCGC14_2003910 [marine sediment metagenome]|uniref:Uncharacterized protein n=1 Tax=marine sediment metagenome TaxID=412755 RepID=A0A0F9F2F2_9ZZZZ